jgi:acetyl esterase/lipase/lysophospholipase L1-like esterase
LIHHLKFFTDTVRTGFFLFAILLNLAAAAQQVMPLYQGQAPGSLPVADKEVVSRPENGRPTVRNVTRPTLTAFIPERQNSARSAVIICPGGGYLNLSIEDGGYEVAKTFAAAGVTAFVLKYRTWVDSAYANYTPVPMMDLQQAVEMVYGNAGKWNLDTSKIGMLGFSAGGHLVASAATGIQRRKPAFTLLVYPVISFTDALTSRTSKTRGTLIGKNPSLSEKELYSPELHVNASTPPAFIVQASDDSTSLVGNSIAYYEALHKNRVSAQLLLYQKGGHGFAAYNKAQDEYWMPAALKWMTLNGYLDKEAKPAIAETLPPFWKDIVAFKKQDAVQPPPAHPILFVGSSSFTKWTDIKEYFPGYPVLNRGFGGSVLTDVIRYAYDVILPYQPKQVLIYCGENDLASSDSITADEVTRRFRTLFGIIRQNLPATRISFVSIKPSPVREKIQPKVKEANAQIKAFIKTQKNADFIDIYGAMLGPGGKMREELYVQDRLHMKPEGYAIWKRILAPYLMN